jgi:hypothetical protein
VFSQVRPRMCLGVDVSECERVTVLLLLIDPALVYAALAVWGWAAVRAASLSYALTPRRIARGAGVVLGLVALGVVLLLVRTGVVAGLATAGWWLVEDRVVLGLPLVAVPVAAVLAVAVPRLVRLWRTAVAFNGIDAMPPSLRRDAAHPLAAGPIELAAYGAAGSGVVSFLSHPATAGPVLGLVTGVAVAALVTWRLAHVRHARLATDVVMPRLRPPKISTVDVTARV